jgi:hypothetical protein
MLSYNDVFDELQNYILDEVNMQNSLRMKIAKSTVPYKNDKTIFQKILQKNQNYLFLINKIHFFGVFIL